MRVRIKGTLVSAVVLACSALTAVAAEGRDAPLPRTGIAVQTPRGVELVGLDGRRRRSLPGFRFRFLGVERPGQVELRDRSGRGYALRAGTLVRVPRNTVMLPAGYALRFERRWSLLRGGRVVELFRPRTHLEVDGSGTVLTAVRTTEDGSVLGATVARNLRTGARRRLPSGCRIGAQADGVRFELCNYPYGNRRPSTVVRVDRHGRRTLAGPPERGPRGPAGHWRSVLLSPRGERLLAQWSGECEIPTAYLIDARTGRLTLLGRDRAGQQIEGRTLGWSGSTPLVSLPRSACAGSADRPGVYAFERGTHARLVYSLPRALVADARIWR